MNKIIFFTILGLSGIIFNDCSASTDQSNSHSILNKETFTTIEEKQELFQALGVEYTHEVTMSKELRRQLILLAIAPEAQTVFASHDYYQECTKKNPLKYQTVAQDRSITNQMVIKKINAAIGHGVIAGANIREGTILGFYAGELKCSADIEDGKNDYSFGSGSITPGCPSLEIDAQYKGNELRFINGSQGHSNCEARNFLVQTGEKRIIYTATANIQKGQEILADYGDAYWASFRAHQYQELATVISKKTENPSAFGEGFKKGFFKKTK